MPKHGTFCWNELMSTDLDKAQRFYSDLIGWEVKDSGMPGMQYMIAHAGDKQACGMMNMPEEAQGVPSHWMSYITVDNVDETTDKAKSLGAEVIHGPQDIPTVGRFVIIKDPTGAVVSLMTFEQKG